MPLEWNGYIFKGARRAPYHVPLVCPAKLYTQMNSKVGNLARRRLEFEPGVADVEVVKLKKLNDADGSQIQWLSDAVKNQFLSSFVYSGCFPRERGALQEGHRGHSIWP